MAVLDPIQTSFAGGELSPRVQGRVDSDLYKRGLARCSNFAPQAQGSLLMRGGSRHVVAPAGLTRSSRVREFPIVGRDSFSLVLGGGRLRVVDVQGRALSVGELDLVRNGSFTYGWTYWTPDDNLQGGGQRSVQGRYYLGTLSALGGTINARVVQRITLPAGTFPLTAELSVLTGIVARVLLGTSERAGDLATLTFTGTDPGGGPTGFTASKAVTQNVTLSGTTNAFLTIEVASPGGSGADNDIGPTPTEDHWFAAAQLHRISLTAAGGGAVDVAAPWTDEQLQDVQVVNDAHKDRAMLFHGRVPSHELLYSAETGAWSFGPIAFTPPVGGWPWAEGCFPAAGELYQGRLWLGGVPGMANTFWASKSGEPYDFTAGNLNGDSFAQDISTKGAILWMQGHRQLLVGTDRGECSITAEGGVITPSNFLVRPESAFGSAPIQALSIGEQVLYVSPDRRKVRALSYNLQENGYQSGDLTFPAEHLTADLVQDAAWAPLADTLFLLLRSGAVVACVYNRPEKVVAWYRVQVGGEVVSIDTTSGPSGSTLWMLVVRAGTVRLEQLPLWDTGPYMDANLTAEVVPAIHGGPGVVEGLSHLEGQVVNVTVDGQAHPQRTVQGGLIALEVPGSSATVGLPYKATAKLLPLEVPTQRGSSMATKRRRAKLALLLNDSALPKVNGDRPFPDRTPDSPMDTVEPRTTGRVTTNLLGWEDEGAITIEQDLPFRTEILAVLGTAALNEV